MKTLDELPGSLREHATRRFRTSLRTNSDQTPQLLELLEGRPDRTDSYLEEIDRLERFSRYHTGFRCWRRTEPFSWQAARGYLRADSSRSWATTDTISNES